MKQQQGGVKLSIIVISIILMGVSAWFNQAGANEQAEVIQEQTQ
ncbi:MULTISPECIES: hypothetical protein [Pseudoalteromonas]|nr:hypothetical protein [Pseudoalteromonas prydzensis]MBE0378272.1 hypothetical protein [Pseudoalteromonas prydzensis ACAM 620]